MLVGNAVLHTPPKPSVLPELPLYTTRTLLSPLESTLTRPSASADSKRLTRNLPPLFATLTKKRGGRSPLPPRSLSTRYYARAHQLDTPVSAQLQSPQSLAHSLKNWISRKPFQICVFRTLCKNTRGRGATYPPTSQVFLEMYTLPGPPGLATAGGCSPQLAFDQPTRAVRESPQHAHQTRFSAGGKP